ncbi:MAG: hypothetical protein E3J72_21840, partial [Planctomycetota bacterium]
DYYADDYYQTCYDNGTACNPRGPASGAVRVIRGGSWNSGTFSLRCAHRSVKPPVTADNMTGFRCVKEASP